MKTGTISQISTIITMFCFVDICEIADHHYFIMKWAKIFFFNFTFYMCHNMEKYSNKKLPILVSCDLLESLNYCLFPNIHTLVKSYHKECISLVNILMSEEFVFQMF
jgi:hypothetical protein